MFLNLVTAAAEAPVTLDEVKRSARIDTDDEDAILDGYLAAAVRSVEEMTGRALMPQTWAYSVSEPSGRHKLELPWTPVASVVSISYFDENDTAQSDTVSNYYLYKDDDKAFLEPKDGFDWPNTIDRDDAITIRFVAGYGSAGLVPEELKHAVILLATHWFEHRVPVAEKAMHNVPYSVEHLVNLYRRGWVRS